MLFVGGCCLVDRLLGLLFWFCYWLVTWLILVVFIWLVISLVDWFGLVGFCCYFVCVYIGVDFVRLDGDC